MRRKEMRKCARLCTLALVACGAVRGELAAQTPAAVPRPSITAGPARGAIRLDGVLDEDAWREAGVIADLVQQAPRPGESTPYRTEVRILADAESLYFGITCVDPEPGRIAVHTMQRDGDMEGDDTVALVFDTFNDRRAYFFRVNVAGARADGLISGPEELSRDWDGIWEAQARRAPLGWTAEIRVPAATLRFTPGAASWGFNVERTVARDRLTLRWAATTLDSRLDDLSRAGVLEGVSQLKQGLGLSIVPYALLNRLNDRPSGAKFLKGEFGGDVRYSLTPQLDGILTINPDFAETEVDTRQINLTRFPLFFPEKRAFFLEGSNLFRFGLGLGNDFIPFYSRRVGLLEEQLIPLDGGLKVLGQAGRWGIAALDVLTGRHKSTPRANLFAGRVTYDVDDHLRVGTVVTNGSPDGVRSNTLTGLDAVWRTSRFAGDKNFFVGLWGALSAGDVGNGQKTGFGVKIDYPNDLWDVNLRFDQYGDSLDPALGFLPRPATRQYRFSAAYQPRPQSGLFGWVRQFFFEFNPSLVTDLRGVTQSWRVFTAPFNVRTQSGEHLEANWAPQFERLDQPFEISPGVVIPAGAYHFNRFRAEAQSSDHRPWRVGATVWFGQFYTGHLTQVFAFANWTSPRGRFSAEVSAENDFGCLPQGNFITRLWQAKAVYAFSPDLILSGYAQYDSESSKRGLERPPALDDQARKRRLPRLEPRLALAGRRQRVRSHDSLGPDRPESPLDLPPVAPA
ncbi:MAG: DUF5916 domain-containing protein [Thermoanaerobaculia bacterium]